MADRRIQVDWPQGGPDALVELNVGQDPKVTIKLKISLTTGEQHSKEALHTLRGVLDIVAAQTAFDTGGQEALFVWMEGQLDGQ